MYRKDAGLKETPQRNHLKMNTFYDNRRSSSYPVQDKADTRVRFMLLLYKENEDFALSQHKVTQKGMKGKTNN